MNKQEYAVAYCDSHECDECYIYKNKLDKRTNTQLNSKYCFENIYDYLKKNKIKETLVSYLIQLLNTCI